MSDKLQLVVARGKLKFVGQSPTFRLRPIAERLHLSGGQSRVAVNFEIRLERHVSCLYFLAHRAQHLFRFPEV
jgi:hypothetical protein